MLYAFLLFALNPYEIFAKKNGVPGWTRTNDPLINSQML